MMMDVSDFAAENIAKSVDRIYKEFRRLGYDAEAARQFTVAVLKGGNLNVEG